MLTNVSDGIKLIKERMASKPILLVLDDVDDREQLEALAGSPDWFCPGSFIIFTGKDKQLLRSHEVDNIHDMSFLSIHKARELFHLYAFRHKHPTMDFMVLSDHVVKCLQGHPLALIVMGSHLYGKSMDVWQSEVGILQKYPDAEIQQKLRPSFDALDFDKKNIFLDIACSFIGEDKDFAASVLGSSAHANIQVLVDKSLITISRDNNLLQMHDLIQSMARRIIHEEFVVKEVWSRLWNLSELRNVLSKNKAIEGLEVLDLSLKQSSPNFHIDGEAFEDMKNLRILKISYGELENFWEDSKVNYSGRLKALSNELTLLYWNGCPFEFPLDFYPENIVVIDLSYSYLKTLWTTPKCFARLKVMKLRHCRNLTNTPDFTSITNLEELILEGCINLVKVHPSFGMLKKLVVLNMRYCKRFRRFPCKVEMDSLEVVNLSGCSKLDKLPEIFSTIQTLREFSIHGTAITELPCFVFSQCNLQVLGFGGHEKRIRSRWWGSISQLSWLPSKIQHPQSQSLLMPSLADLCFLRELNFSHCNISEVSDSIGCLSFLEYLNLQGNIFTSFPAGCLSQLPRLHHLQLSGCKELEVLPELPPSLKTLYASYCTSLHQHPPNNNYYIHSFSMYFNGCPILFRNLSIESQVCMSQPLPDHNPSITTQISSLLQFMELPSNTCGIFGGQERQFFQGDLLEIIYHGNRIPQWFTNTKMGNHIHVELPPNFCYNKFRGYGICVIFTQKRSYGRHNYNNAPRYRVDHFDGTSLLEFYPFGYSYTGIRKSDMIWFCFTTWVDPNWQEAKNFVTFSIVHDDDLEVKECGCRLVFDEDIEETTNFSLTQDLPTPTEEGGAIQMWRNNRRFFWSL
ncbi:TMV resistance protein N-like [Cynara cardunculus var. scolymus]|uniref:TMV resistance protein N-like n=1 Tax=Cynara cardunculus var. scolymus TaxID=59895 RepID=UPI000D62A5F8|nr:TMV resistance protein N-like [Cynara cardunculus var. scolymus]